MGAIVATTYIFVIIVLFSCAGFYSLRVFDVSESGTRIYKRIAFSKISLSP